MDFYLIKIVDKDGYVTLYHEDGKVFMTPFLANAKFRASNGNSFNADNKYVVVTLVDFKE